MFWWKWDWPRNWPLVKNQQTDWWIQLQRKCLKVNWVVTTFDTITAFISYDSWLFKIKFYKVYIFKIQFQAHFYPFPMGGTCQGLKYEQVFEAKVLISKTFLQNSLSKFATLNFNLCIIWNVFWIKTNCSFWDKKW